MITIKRLLSLDIIKAEQCVEGEVNPKVSGRLWWRWRRWSGGVEGMDIEKIHGVSGSPLTDVLRHQVALAQVPTQDGDGRKRERLEWGARFRNIPERDPVIVPCERRVRGCATAGGIISESACHTAHL